MRQPIALVGLCALGLAACELGSKDTSQRGYRGTAMVDLYDQSKHTAQFAAVAAHIPASLPPAPPPEPGTVSPWQNVQVLTDIGPAEMTRTMLAMSTWVAGTGNCAYCHNVAAPADDTLPGGTPIYPKLVARRMLRMVRDINGNYANHVKNTGVTCYTCHLGQPVPKSVWTYDGDPNQLERYYLDRDAVRVQSHIVPASNDNRSSAKQTEWTYALMIHQSRALGVNCTHCHNTRNFASWTEAPPQRVQAYVGSQMVRHINQRYVQPLGAVLPASRLGPMGDAPKVECRTCHNGAYKPLYGYPMAKDYPALWGRPDWDGAPFPGLQPAGAMNGDAGAAMDAPVPDAGATPAPAGATPAAPGRAVPAATPPPATPAAGAPAPQPVRDPSAGAMGGRGPAGKDTVGRAPR